MNRISINGIDIVGGRNITINGDTVIIDGVRQDGSFAGPMELRILEGAVESLITDRSVTCGAISGNVQAGGTVNCAEVAGSVRAGGTVNCDDVKGNVQAGGTVNCDNVGGNVTASIVKRG